MEGSAAAPAPKLYYGWWIVFISAMGLFFSAPGQTYSNSVFIDHYIRDFGWSRSLVSGIYSGATLIAGVLLMLIGRLVDRWGQRRMMVVVGGMLALSCFWNSVVFTPVMLFVGFLCARLFGQGSMTLVPNTLVPQWFIKKRGRALSLMMIGGFAGATFAPMINAWLIDQWSWPVAWRVWGIALLLVFVPTAWVWVRNTPEEMGLLPDQSGARTSDSSEEEPEEESWTLREAMKTRSFWLILVCVSIPALVNTGLTFHLTSIFREQGLGVSTAALVLGLMAFTGFPMTLVSGYIVDRFPVQRVLAGTFLIQLVFLVWVLQVHSPMAAIVFALLWGTCNGLEQIILSAIWPEYFGRRYLGSIRGVAMMMVVGSALGPLPFGVAFDHFGGYMEIIFLTCILPVIGFLAAALSPPPQKSAAAEKG
ncbi:MFS transporter [Paludifilum halophilum]|uniref:MFS transporter n=2 Tax=Paludifilum halophilum TaxID=1642702 RepID=A0A235B5J7_9BACL|nr:MFS transporter [Paludifilum halophilum]